jgi:RNA polymerase sigma-70 factor, ECF subfamily
MFFRNAFKELSDEILMEKISEGSEPALEVIYDRYSQPLLRYFYRMLWKNRELAEDFLQDIFIKILRVKNFDNTRTFSTWIYSVAHNMCKNEYRKHAFRASATLAISEFVHEEISTQLDHHSFNKVIEDTLREEDEEISTMFVLRFELDMEVSEIARVLNCPEGTIKSRLFYLKKKLASQLCQYKTVLKN